MTPLKFISLLFAFPLIPIGFIWRSMVMGFTVGMFAQENLPGRKQEL